MSPRMPFAPDREPGFRNLTRRELRALLSVPDPEPGPADVAADRDDAALIRGWIGWLPRREAYVVRRRLGLIGPPGATLANIGGEIRLTRERVRALEHRGFRRLREIVPLRYRINREGIIERCPGRS